uniref:Uncharacterized protein n=1 Tax=Setaria digitata TaxID=48799 RepID=A0A915PXC0_9BILA
MYIVPGESKGELEFAMGRIGWAVLGGYAVGSLRGLLPELRNPNTRQLPFKPFMTRLMNSSVKHGSGFAHPTGSIVFIFSVADMIFGKLRAKDDLNAIAAGAVTGGLFRCAHGLHASVIGAGIGVVAAFIWLLSDQDSRNRMELLTIQTKYKQYKLEANIGSVSEHGRGFSVSFNLNGVPLSLNSVMKKRKSWCEIQISLKYLTSVTLNISYEEWKYVASNLNTFQKALLMDDDLVDLLVVSSVAAVGFIALTYIVTKTYSDQIKMRLTYFKKKPKHITVAANIIVQEHPKSILTIQKFSVTIENSEV